MRLQRTRFAAAVILAAAAGFGIGAPSPAQAAACGSDTGVTVVVDFHELGGGVRQACDADGADKTAATLFTDNGFSLTYVQRQPGFVCRVQGAPAEDSCVNTPPADAYWSLFWSEGTSGTWKYATEGVGSLTVPDGGYVAFSWQGSSTKSPPGVAPAAHGSSASPSPSTGGSPTPRPTPTSSSGPAGPTTPATPVATEGPAAQSPSGKGKHGAHDKTNDRTQPAAPTPTATSTAAAIATPADPGDGSGAALPGWVVPGVLLLLGAAGGLTAYVRRRGAATP